MIGADFNGQVPSAVIDLLQLPGVGRYTAGAVSSLAFEKRSPILDGNVARVLCRLDCITQDPRTPAVRDELWKRAETILPKKRLADFNSALMELGALVCTPRSPQCLMCPVNDHCEAFARNLQDQIPPAKKAKKSPVSKRWTFCIRHRDRFLIEQRPAKGRWAGMWQFVTFEAQTEISESSFLKSAITFTTTSPRKIGHVKHALTHRRYQFDVFACEAKKSSCLKLQEAPSRKWVTLKEIIIFPLPRPHVRIVEMLQAGSLVSGREKKHSPA